jgi:hypothetical protein
MALFLSNNLQGQQMYKVSQIMDLVDTNRTAFVIECVRQMFAEMALTRKEAPVTYTFDIVSGTNQYALPDNLVRLDRVYVLDFDDKYREIPEIMGYVEPNLNALTEAGVVVTPTVSTAWITFKDGYTTPSVALGTLFKTANTTPTVITDFDSPIYDGQHIIVYFGDAMTTITHDVTKISLEGGVDRAFSTGDILEFVNNGGVWEAYSARIA